MTHVNVGILNLKLFPFTVNLDSRFSRAELRPLGSKKYSMIHDVQYEKAEMIQLGSVCQWFLAIE